MTDFGAAILEGIQGINGRLDRIEARLERVETRLEQVEARLDRVETRLERVEARQDHADLDLKHLRGSFEALPDFRLMMVRSEVTLKKINDVQHELIDLRARLGEVYGAMATDAEINIFREEMKTFREASLNNEIRLRTLEAHVLGRPEAVD